MKKQILPIFLIFISVLAVDTIYVGELQASDPNSVQKWEIWDSNLNVSGNITAINGNFSTHLSVGALQDYGDFNVSDILGNTYLAVVGNEEGKLEFEAISLHPEGSTGAFASYTTHEFSATDEVLAVARISNTTDYNNTGALQVWYTWKNGGGFPAYSAQILSNTPDSNAPTMKLWGNVLPDNPDLGVLRITNKEGRPAISVDHPDLVNPNLNADYLDGYNSTDFLMSCSTCDSQFVNQWETWQSNFNVTGDIYVNENTIYDADYYDDDTMSFTPNSGTYGYYEMDSYYDTTFGAPFVLYNMINAGGIVSETTNTSGTGLIGIAEVVGSAFNRGVVLAFSGTTNDTSLFSSGGIIVSPDNGLFSGIKFEENNVGGGVYNFTMRTRGPLFGTGNSLIIEPNYDLRLEPDTFLAIRTDQDDDDYLNISTTSNVMTIDFVGHNGKITSVANPTANQDVATKNYVDTAPYVGDSGSQTLDGNLNLTGNLDVGGYANITGDLVVSGNTDIDGYLSIDGGWITGDLHIGGQFEFNNSNFEMEVDAGSSDYSVGIILPKDVTVLNATMNITEGGYDDTWFLNTIDVDTHNQEDNPTYVYVNETIANIAGSTTNKDAHGYFWYNITNITEAVAGKLEWYYNAASPTTQVIYVKRVTADWNPENMTWNNPPSVGSASTLVNFSSGSPTGWYNLTINTEMLNDLNSFMNGTLTNYGWEFSADDQTSVYPYRQIRTEDYAGSYDPMLWTSTPQYPENITIDVGIDGHIDYTFNDVLNTTTEEVDLNVTAINNYLDSCIADDDGLCTVPLNITSVGGGVINLHALTVLYDADLYARNIYANQIYAKNTTIGSFDDYIDSQLISSVKTEIDTNGRKYLVYPEQFYTSKGEIIVGDVIGLNSRTLEEYRLRIEELESKIAQLEKLCGVKE